MAEENWLPLAEVARRSNVPETTARRYARLFPDALPHKREGRTLLYASSAGAVLARIGQLFSDGRSASQVSEALRAESQCIDVESAGGRGSDPVDRQALASAQPVRPREDGRNRLAEFLRHVVDQKQAITALREDFSQVRRELAEERMRRRALEEENRKIKKALVLLMRQRRAAAGQSQAAQPAASGNDVRAKLGVLEQELIRLRKDRREFEKYLLEKIGKPE